MIRPKFNWSSVVDVCGGESRVWCSKEQYCIGTWNVKFINTGKLYVVNEQMAKVNTDILGISELKWSGIGEFNSDYYIYYCGQESLRRNEVALIVNKRVQNAVLGWIIEKPREFQKKHLLLLFWLCQCFWLCGSQQIVENSSRDGNTRPPDPPPEKSVCRSRSNS